MDVAVAMAVVAVAVAGTAMAGWGWEEAGCIKWWRVRRRTLLNVQAQGRMYAAG